MIRLGMVRLHTVSETGWVENFWSELTKLVERREVIFGLAFDSLADLNPFGWPVASIVIPLYYK